MELNQTSVFKGEHLGSCTYLPEAHLTESRTLLTPLTPPTFFACPVMLWGPALRNSFLAPGLKALAS